MRLLAALTLALALGGCFSAPAPAPPEAEHIFLVDGIQYKLTREHGSDRLLLWRREGISWRLVRDEE